MVTVKIKQGKLRSGWRTFQQLPGTLLF